MNTRYSFLAAAAAVAVLGLSGCGEVASALHSLANTLDPTSSTQASASQGAPGTAQSSEANRGKGLPLPDVVLRNDTPDMAIRTHFELVRRYGVRVFNRVKTPSRTQNPDIDIDASKLYSGEARHYYDVKTGKVGRGTVPHLYQQNEEILKLVNESDTRAIALVRIKLTGPLHPLADDEGLKRGRELQIEGEEYRFVMTKSSAGWTVESIQRLAYVGSGDLKKDWELLPQLQRSRPTKWSYHPSVDIIF